MLCAVAWNRLKWVAAALLTLAVSGCDGGDMSGTLDGGTSTLPDGAPRPDGAVLGDGSTGVDSGSGPVSCDLRPACDAPLPDPGMIREFDHWTTRNVTVTQPGGDRHRGRDLLLRADDPQWALAKFAYGFPADDDLKDEDVDIYLLRDCGTSWEFLATVRTTRDGDHATVEGVEDTGGWVFFEIPADRRLGPGRHRLHFFVAGDHSEADQYIEVIEPGTRLVVSDVDGTLTESETAEFQTLWNGDPAARPSSPEMLRAFAEKGYLIFYLTARPHWLHARTHRWLNDHMYPPGLVHTTLAFEGALGGDAETFKTDELNAIGDRLGHPPDYAFGNTDSDAAAYANATIAPTQRYLYQFDGDALGGQQIDDYATVIPVAESQVAMCR